MLQRFNQLNNLFDRHKFWTAKKKLFKWTLVYWLYKTQILEYANKSTFKITRYIQCAHGDSISVTTSFFPILESLEMLSKCYAKSKCANRCCRIRWTQTVLVFYPLYAPRGCPSKGLFFQHHFEHRLYRTSHFLTLSNLVTPRDMQETSPLLWHIWSRISNHK